MSLDLRPDNKDRATPRSLMPPYIVLPGFLDQTTVASLFDYALSRQTDFAPTRLWLKAVNPAVRVSAVLRELGGFRNILKTKVPDLVPNLIAQLRGTPFDAPKLETELVAHGDDALYKRHIDTQTAHYDDVDQIRLLSGVYYFHTEPRAFTGGSFRLYAIGGNAADNFVDIEPVRNSLLVFPSWAPHAVMPVSCPSERFIDSRFAINRWVHRKKGVPALRCFQNNKL